MPWNNRFTRTVDPAALAQARAVQEDLRGRVRIEDAFETISHIAGVDVGFEQDGEITRAAVVVLAYPSLERVHESLARLPTTFPYIPGYLSFREIPAILKAWEDVPRHVQMVLVDGIGIAHPRRLGIASHLGVALDVPTIGVAKSRLVGQHDEVGLSPGDSVPLLLEGERVGTVVRTKARSLPLFVSPGHRVSVETALSIVVSCLRGYRLPEPTRLADKVASTRHWKKEAGLRTG